MHWLDSGIVLSARKYGENSVILQAFTKEHGRCAGLVRGGTSKKLRGILQPGNIVGLKWQSRIADQLGTYTIEAGQSSGALLFDRPLSLAACSSIVALLEKTLPEKEIHSPLFEASSILLGLLDDDIELWGPLLVKWELGLLSEMGYGLDLSECAATGVKENLAYVSPKSGRAVSREAGTPYGDRLLPLPDFLCSTNHSENEINLMDVEQGLRLSGYFIKKNLIPHYGGESLPARERLVHKMNKTLNKK
ncbi:DNA repair protein RecO [Sneathiella sp. P13V-1]|uniref:DNA repair protein RecO n=1 Tax=Sneathiella sp. P13V-1 TaxID=2697366 RepID=UPI00187B77D2|nr:DNA repair protein RecO [Sneathiella sp. P13V-1]MBE7636890.1 DNA repair protein RecO [Sneathiella sp. P13V-1]